MKTERMIFQVNPGSYGKDFLLADAETWNSWLKQQPGFLNKTTRVLGNGLVELILFWRDQGSLDNAAAKGVELAAVDQLMRQRFPGSYNLVSSSVY
jgi:hypothetical protein